MPATAPRYERAVAHAAALGHSVVALDFAPLHAVAELLYGGPWVAERHAVVQALLERAARGASIRTRAQRDRSGARLLARPTRFAACTRCARRSATTARDLWSDVDLLMVPTAPGHPRHAEVDADPIGVNARARHATPTSSTCSAGARSRCRPASPTHGLPFGVTFIAPGAQRRGARALRRALAGERSTLPLGATDARARRDATRVLDAGAPWPASEPTLPIAVVGAHLSGLPLNGQLVERGATLARGDAHRAALPAATRCPDTTPPKPGLLRVARRRRRDRGRGVGHAARRGRLVSRADPAAARPRQRRAGRRPPRARLPLRGACARRRRRHQRARRLARLPRQPARPPRRARP